MDSLIVSELSLLVTILIALPTAFLFLVLHIVFRCPQKQMARIYTRWIVTSVTYEHSIRDYAIFKFPSESMRTNIFTMCLRKLSITSCTKALFPRPTLVRFSNIKTRIKSLFNSWRLPESITVSKKSCIVLWTQAKSYFYAPAVFSYSTYSEPGVFSHPFIIAPASRLRAAQGGYFG